MTVPKDIAILIPLLLFGQREVPAICLSSCISLESGYGGYAFCASVRLKLRSLNLPKLGLASTLLLLRPRRFGIHGNSSQKESLCSVKLSASPGLARIPLWLTSRAAAKTDICGWKRKEMQLSPSFHVFRKIKRSRCLSLTPTCRAPSKEVSVKHAADSYLPSPSTHLSCLIA